MNNKMILSIIILMAFIIFGGVFIGYLMDNDGHINENDLKILGISPEVKTGLTVSSEGPLDLDDLIFDIRNKSYYDGYDNNTLLWMSSLSQKEVFLSDAGYIIMNKYDASKINTVYITDAYIEEYINCIIVENRSLGGNHSKDILLVRDVDNVGNKTFDLQDN